MGETVARTLCGEETAYDPGIWFNSAKFLDIEYQVYGRVPNKPVEGLEHLYWEHPGGRTSLRLVHRAGTFVGLNVMGQRYRHRVCERWIREDPGQWAWHQRRWRSPEELARLTRA